MKSTAPYHIWKNIFETILDEKYDFFNILKNNNNLLEGNYQKLF